MDSPLYHYTSVVSILHVTLWSEAATEDNTPRAETMRSKYCHSLLQEQQPSVGSSPARDRSPSHQESAHISATASSKQLPHLSTILGSAPVSRNLQSKLELTVV